MNGGASSELNAVLKAKVVKLKILLDINGSKLPTQVNNITKFLKEKPVKLSVKLDMSSKALNAQLKDMNSKVMTNTAFKPIKIKIELDEKNGKSIKTELEKVITAIRNFNNTYGKLVKETQENQKKLKASTDLGGNVPTSASVGNFNNIKQYNKQLEETRRIMNSKLPKGENGLFSSTQMKDAQGNLRGFVASLQKANGVVEQVRYEWNTKKGQFTLIDRKVMTNTEAMVHKASQSLRDMQRELGKTGKASKEMTAEYKRLEQAGKDGTLNSDMVKAYQTRIKNVIQEQNEIKATNAVRREEAKIIREIKNLTAKTGKEFSAQSQALMSKVRSAKDLEAMKDLRLEVTKLGDSVTVYKNKQKEATSVEKQREIAQKKLTQLLRETSETQGILAREEIKATQAMAKRARTTEDMIAVQKRLNSMDNAKSALKNNDAVNASLQKLEKTMLNYARVGGQSADTIAKKYEMSKAKVGRNVAAIEKEISYYSDKIIKKNNDVARSQLDLARNSVVKGVNHGTVRSLVDTKDVNKVKDYLAQVLKLDIATAKLSTNDAKGISTITATLASTGKTAKQVTYQIDQLTNKLRIMGSQEVFNRNANLGIFEQLRVAMARVPIWMAAMTAFYGSIRVVKNVTDEILKLDKALTEIKRVASDNINIDTMFRGSVDLSKELGNNVHEILASVGELSRTFGDMNERQLLSITRTGTLMANVSDLNAEEAVQTLVGTMNAFNIEAEESIRIVDSLNEVDNNFAISTKQLSEGLSKSASTAKTFGVTMEESIGHITAIGSVTMESGRLIGNSLKTIYSRITTLGAAEAILEGVGVAVAKIGENGEEYVRPVGEILDDLGGKWHGLTAAEQQHIGVTVAGRYQLSRFLALMNNYDTALDASTTAVFSQGSAMRENAEYMKSYEARINQLKNGWTELSDAIGNAFMKSAMMEVLRLLTGLAQMAVNVSNAVGVLPIVFGALVAVLLKMGVFNALKATIGTAMTGIGVAFLDASAKGGILTRTFATLRNVGNMSMSSLTARASTMRASLSASFAAASAAVRGFTVAFQGMLASTLIGVAFVGLGVAIEKLMKLYNEKQEKEKALITLNDKMITSYRDQRDGLASVVERHAELSDMTGRSADEEREYLGLQKQLAEQLPTTVSYIDANGKAHMKTTEQIDKEVEAVKQLSIEEAKLTNAKFHEGMEKKSKSYMKIIDNIDELAEKQARLEDNDGKNAWFNGNMGEDNMSLLNPTIDNTVAIQQNKVDVMMAEAEKTGAIQKTLQAVQEQSVAYFEAGNKMAAMGDGQQAMVEAFIGQNEAMLRGADTPEKFEKAYRDLFEIGVEVGDVFVEAYDIMSKDIGDDPLKLQELQSDLGQVAKSIPESFMMLEDEFGKPIKSLEEVESGMKEIINVSQHVSAGSKEWDTLAQRLENAGLSADQSQGFLKDLANEHGNAELKAIAQAQGVDGLAESTEGYTEAAMEAFDITSGLFGYSSAELEGVKNHLQMMHLLVDTQGEAAKESEKYVSSQMAVAEFLNVTTEEVEKNQEAYFNLADALTSVDWTEYTPETNLDEFIDAQEISDASKSAMKSWDGLTEFLTGKSIEIEEANKTTEDSVGKVKEVFEKEVNTDKGVAGAIQDARKEAEDDDWIVGLIKRFDELGDIDIPAPDMGKWLSNLIPDNIFGGLTDGGGGTAITDWFESFIPPSLQKDLDTMGTTVGEFFNTLPTVIEQGTPKVLSATDDFFGNIPSSASKYISETASGIGKWWTDVSIRTDESMTNYANSLGTWLSGLPSRFTNWTSGLADRFTSWIQNLPERTVPLLENWYNATKLSIQNAPEMFAVAMESWGTAIENFVTSLPSRFTGQWEAWWTSISNWYMGHVGDTTVALEGWGLAIENWIGGLPERFVTQWDAWWTSISDWYMSHVDDMTTALEGWGTAITDWFAGLPEATAERMNIWWTAITDWFTGHIENIREHLESWGTAIVEWFTTMPDRILTALLEWGFAIDNWLDEQRELNEEAYSKWGTSILEFFTGMPDRIVEAFTTWTSTFANWFTETTTLWGENLNAWWTVISEWFVGLPESIGTWMLNWWTAIGNWFTETSTLWGENLNTWWTSITTWFAETATQWGEHFNLWWTAISEWFIGIAEQIGTWMFNWWTAIGTWFTDTATLWGENLGKWGTAISDWFTNIPTQFGTWLGGWWTGIVLWFTQTSALWGENLEQWWTAISTWFTDLPSRFTEGLDGVWTAITTWFSDTRERWGTNLDTWLQTIRGWFTTLPQNAEVRDTGEKVVDEVTGGIRENGDDILEAIAEFVLRIPLYVLGAAGVLIFALGREIIENVIAGINGGRELWRNTWNDIQDRAMEILTNLARDTAIAGTGMITDLIGAVTSRVGDFGSAFTELADTAMDRMRELGTDLVDYFVALPERMGNAIRDARQGVTSGITSLVNTMGDALEGGLNGTIVVGVNSVLDWMSVPKKNRMPQFNIPAFAKGTKNGTHKGGHALVGEEGYELAHIPNQGTTLLGKNGAEIRNLPKGTSVLPHAETKKILNTYNFPAYKDGVGGAFDDLLGQSKSLLSNTGSKISSGLGAAKDMLVGGFNSTKDAVATGANKVGDLYTKYMGDPKKVITDILSQLPFVNPLSGGAGTMIGGAMSKVKDSAIDYAKNKMGSMFDGTDGGQGVASFGNLRKTSSFGMRMHPIYKTMRLHAGDDYAGAINTAIKAQVGGIVTRSGASGTGWGTMVQIKNGIYDYIYAHLNRAMAKVGTPVGKGSIIGLLGNTGASTGPHLHYEVHKNGRPVKPNAVQGFEIGGKVSKEQIIRVGEGDKEEMIIPLEQHKDRAVSLWKEAGERLGQFQYFAKGGTVGTASKTTPKNYTVKSGDTLGEIAQEFKTTVKQLMQVNKNIKNSNKISVGQVLSLKDLGKAGSGSSTTANKATKTFSKPLTTEQQLAKWQNSISLTEKQMSNISVHSEKYRSKMEDILGYEQNILKSQKQILKETEKRQSVISTKLGSIPKTKRTEKQQEEYDNLNGEYDQNIEKIQSLKVEIEGAASTIKERTLAIFTNLVDGIITTSEKRLERFSQNISELDFRIKRTGFIDPNNEAKILKLETDKSNQLNAQRKESSKFLAETQKSYQKAVKQYGVGSEQALRWKDELTKVKSGYESITLEALDTAKALKEMKLESYMKNVDGKTSTSDKRLKVYEKNISDIDFKIDLAEITDPENYKKIADLQTERAKQLKGQQKESQAILNETQKNYDKSVKQYGVNSDQARRWKEELEKVREGYQGITLEALNAEKAIKDERGEVADNSIEQLKDYYGTMSELATESIDAEIAELEKAHDAKMKLYDEEAEKINSVYDEKLKAMDKEKSDTEYLDNLNEKNTKKAELLAKIALLSRDTSIEGRKKVAELEKELVEVNEDISTTQKDRQESLVREELEAQKQAQLEAINLKKENAEKELEFGSDMTDDGKGGTSGLTKQKEDIEKYYADLLNNEKYWADLRKGYIDGSNTQLNTLLNNMYTGVKALNSGNYGAVKGFENLSAETQKEIKEGNAQDLANMKTKNDVLNKEVVGNQQANKVETVKKGRILTGHYMSKSRAEQIKKVFGNDYGSTNIKVVADPKSKGWKVQGDFATTIRANEVKDHLIARKLMNNAQVSSFDTGGYTGAWGNQGKLAVLHEKELVLNKSQTRDILDTSKIMERISKAIPSLKRSSMTDKLATASGVNISNNYELTVNIDNLNGDKKGAESVATTVIKGLKKMGR